jgi:anti-sigma B factor antagonist
MNPPRPSPLHPPKQVVPPSERLASVNRREEDGVIIAAVRGEIDVSNATEVGRELTDISDRVLGLVVDLGSVGHLDSSGIALLHELHACLDRREQSLVVVAPQGSAARRVLELTAFDTRAPVTADVEAAVIAVQSIAAGRPPAPGDPE